MCVVRDRIFCSGIVGPLVFIVCFRCRGVVELGLRFTFGFPAGQMDSSGVVRGENLYCGNGDGDLCLIEEGDLEMDVEGNSLELRLDQFLKIVGIAQTGGHAKLMIQGGEVQVNGELETRRRRKLRPGDMVTVGGESVEVVAEPG